MERIKIRKNKVIVNLNNQFYTKELIQNSIRDFNNVCSAQLEENKDYFLVILRPKENIPTKKIALEFCNYCLGLMKC
ncbi:MAG: HxsD-like protein [Nanoarchaeota archaeon]|nr:HxsD-like protein [Nanoarchaeota archaeon]